MGFELVWIRGDGLAVVGGSSLIVAAGVFYIAQVEESAGIAWVLAQILLQERPGCFEIMLVDFSFSRLAVRLVAGGSLGGGWRAGGIMGSWGELVLRLAVPCSHHPGQRQEADVPL